MCHEIFGLFTVLAINLLANFTKTNILSLRNNVKIKYTTFTEHMLKFFDFLHYIVKKGLREA